MNTAIAYIYELAAIIMRPRFNKGLIFILLLFGCGQTNKSFDKTKVKIKLVYEVIPEDYDRKLYSISWQDTLGKSEGYLPKKILRRPKEIWCFVTNKKMDTLGYYKGLSTAQTFAYFQTTDTIVILNFKAGLNIFSDKFDNDKEGKKHWDTNKTSAEFEPIDFNIKTGLRKKFEIELTEK